MEKGLGGIGPRIPAALAVIGRPLRDYAPLVRWGLLVIWLVMVFAFGSVSLEKPLAWTALLLGVLTIAQILMHAPDDAAPEHRPSDALPSSTT